MRADGPTCKKVYAVSPRLVFCPAGLSSKRNYYCAIALTKLASRPTVWKRSYKLKVCAHREAATAAQTVELGERIRGALALSGA